MTNFIREMFGSISDDSRPGDVLGTPPETGEIAHLDARLAGVAGVARSRTDGATTAMLRPSDCAVWDGNPRDVPALTPDNCKTLIESIAIEGVNRIPVLVRRASSETGPPYELLAGSRRRFAVDWLNHNGRPELRLNAVIVDVSDQEAFRIADLENRERADISEIDRARSYQAAVDRFYGGVQSKMAQALNLSNSQLSRLLSLAQLPNEVVDAFPSRNELRIRHSEVLTPLLRKAESRAPILDAARGLSAEQRQRMAGKESPISAAAVLSRLRQAVLNDPRKARLSAPDGDVARIETVRQGRDGRIEVNLSIGSEADIEGLMADLASRLRLMMAEAEPRRDAA